MNGFGIEFALEKVIVKKKIDTERAENEREKGGDVANEIHGDFDGEEEGDEENAGKVGGVGHATQKTGSTVFLPDGVKSSFDVFLNIKLGVEVVPAGEKGVRFVVEKNQKTSDEKEDDDGPDAS